MNNIRYISLKELDNQINNLKIDSKNPIRILINKYKVVKKQRERILNNKKYIEQKVMENKALLENIKGCRLDKEQTKAIIIEEDSCLIIAGAGSGKTLTMLGKIKYLIEVKKIDPSKILCLSFTNAITEDLKEAIREEINVEMNVLTFHKLGLKVLKENNVNVKIIEEKELINITENHVKKLNKNEVSKYFKTELDLEKLILTFINLYKSGEYKDLKEISNKIETEKNRFIKKRNKYVFKIITDIYNIYQKKLEMEEKIDFNDMINEASSLIEEGYNYPKYDYIIVDEYQDTSYIRYKLLNLIKEKNNCPILAVGDDWQSIYRFTGCNIEMFINFKKYFKYSYITKIQTTYRNPQELIDIAGLFVMKNPNQYKKNLKSNKSYNKPIKVFLYESEEEIDYILKEIPKDRKRILLLGRNNNDFKDINIKDNRVEKMTVHKSKGLQCDTAIIINLKNSINGFPNQMVDDIIFKYLLKQDIYPFEEERRLFYVALTRTKNEVYLFSPKNNQSIFVKELITSFENKIEILSKNNYCPLCKNRYINNKCPICKKKNML